jgi:hypothetical protein
VKALFVGGPWSGDIREVNRPGVVIANEVTDLGELLNDSINFNAAQVLGYTVGRPVRYSLMRVTFFGTLLNLYVSEDMWSNPHLHQSLGLMLLREEFREAVV